MRLFRFSSSAFLKSALFIGCIGLSLLFEGPIRADNLEFRQNLIKVSDTTAAELERVLSGVYGTGYYLRDNPRIISDYKLRYEAMVHHETAKYLEGIYKMRRHTGSLQQAGSLTKIGYNRARRFIRIALQVKKEQVSYLLSLDERSFSESLFPRQESNPPAHHLYSEMSIASDYLLAIEALLRGEGKQDSGGVVSYIPQIPLVPTSPVERRDGFSEILLSVGRDLLADAPLAAVNPPAAGEILFAGYLTGFGYCLILGHADGVISITGSLAGEPEVTTGSVVAGQVVGYSPHDRKVFQAFFTKGGFVDPESIFSPDGEDEGKTRTIAKNKNI